MFASATIPLRTYSRHGTALKRSSFSHPQHSAHTANASKNDAEVVREHRSESELAILVKPERASCSFKRRPIDVFWAHLSASAPAFTRLQSDHMEEVVLLKQIEPQFVAATFGTEQPSVKKDGEVQVRQGREVSRSLHRQKIRMNTFDAIASRDVDHDQDEFVVKNGEDSPLVWDLLDDITFTSSQEMKVRRGRFLCLSSSSAARSQRKTRRFQDIDESLSVVKSSSARARKHSLSTNAQVATSDFDESRSPREPKDTSTERSLDGFNSPSDPWPIPSPTVQSKHVDFKEFREVRAAVGARGKYSNDGFEREEARPGYVSKKRRVDGSERNIGPLELTKKDTVLQKIEGPTWLRGQKKARTGRAASPWSRGQYSGGFLTQIETKDSTSAVDNRQTARAEKITRCRPKRRISRISDSADGADMSESLTAFPGDTDELNDSAYDDAEVTESPQTKHQTSFPHSGDADELVDLLGFPFDDEDEIGFTIPRSDSPEPTASIDRQPLAQLPPKRWMLGKLQDHQDALTLRPDRKAWSQYVPKVSETGSW